MCLDDIDGKVIFAFCYLNNDCEAIILSCWLNNDGQRIACILYLDNINDCENRVINNP